MHPFDSEANKELLNLLQLKIKFFGKNFETISDFNYTLTLYFSLSRFFPMAHIMQHKHLRLCSLAFVSNLTTQSCLKASFNIVSLNSSAINLHAELSQLTTCLSHLSIRVQIELNCCKKHTLHISCFVCSQLTIITRYERSFDYTCKNVPNIA